MDIIKVWSDYYTNNFTEDDECECTGCEEVSDSENKDEQVNSIKYVER